MKAGIYEEEEEEELTPLDGGWENRLMSTLTGKSHRKRTLIVTTDESRTTLLSSTCTAQGQGVQSISCVY